MSDMPPEVIVVVEPPLPPVQVVVEAPLPAVEVTVSTQGLPGPAGPAADLSGHINDPNPHPVFYDTEGVSLTLLYENAKV